MEDEDSHEGCGRRRIILVSCYGYSYALYYICLSCDLGGSGGEVMRYVVAYLIIVQLCSLI